jgi:hypothetical protein
MLELGPCVGLVALAVAGSAWTIHYRRRLSPATAWGTCGIATWAVLFGAVHFLLPHYNRRFSMRDHIQPLLHAAYDPRLPVICYPHYWDAVGFYLKREDVRAYGRDSRDCLLADLERQPATLLFVKTGADLKNLLQSLPRGVDFVVCAQSRTVTVGVIHSCIE